MGDLLPSTIYIPYLKMLRGLASGPQCAHYCFSLLKVNGSSHGKKSDASALSQLFFFRKDSFEMNCGFILLIFHY